MNYAGEKIIDAHEKLCYEYKHMLLQIRLI